MHQQDDNKIINQRRSAGRTHQQAFSLLEVVVAMVVVGMILVPTTALMSEVIRGSNRQQQRAELLHLASGKQDEYRHAVRSNFRSRIARGSFSREGFPKLRYEVNCSDAPTDGGIISRLMSIKTVAWDDINRNRRREPGETSVELWTAVARSK